MNTINTMNTIDPIIQHAFDFIANAIDKNIDEYGRNPIHYCCLFPAPDALKIILPLKHFNINQSDCIGYTPLLHILQGYNVDSREFIYKIVELLLENGACPNIHKINTLSPLIIAVLHKDPILIQMLLNYGANPDFRLKFTESLLIPSRSSALYLAINPPKINGNNSSLLTPLDIQNIWTLLQVSSTKTINHAIHYLDKSVRNIIQKMIEIKSLNERQ